MGIHIGGLVAVVVFYLLILAIGIWAARKTGLRLRNIDSNEVMLAGRNIGFLLGCFTMTATWVGGGFINGSSEVVASSGLVWCQAPLYYGFSTICGGIFFAEKMRAREYNTMLDPFERKYGRLMSMLLYIPALCGDVFWSGAILAALDKRADNRLADNYEEQKEERKEQRVVNKCYTLLSGPSRNLGYFPFQPVVHNWFNKGRGGTLAVILDLDSTISIIISASISLVYTLAGGLYSVAYTDVLQLILMFIGLWLSVPFAMTNDVVPDITTNSSALWLGEVTPSDIGLYVDMGMLMAFGGIPWQVYFQRVLSAKTPTLAMRMSYVAGFSAIAMSVPAILIGAVGAVADWNQTDYQGDVQENLSLVLPLVLRYLCPTWVGIIGLGAVSAAVMSSTDSSMLATSTMFARNIFSSCFTMVKSMKPSGTATVWAMRGMQVFHAVLACVLAIKVKSIYVLFYLCSDLTYVALFPQLACVIYMKSSNTYGSLAGFVIGLLFRGLGGDQDLGIDPVIKYPWYNEERGQLFPYKTLTMLISFFTIMLVSFLAKFLFENGYLSKNLDFFHCFFPSSSSELDKGHKNELNYTIEETKEIQTLHGDQRSSEIPLLSPGQRTEQSIPLYKPRSENKPLNPRSFHIGRAGGEQKL